MYVPILHDIYFWAVMTIGPIVHPYETFLWMGTILMLPTLCVLPLMRHAELGIRTVAVLVLIGAVLGALLFLDTSFSTM